MSKDKSRRLAAVVCGREKSPGQASQGTSWGTKKNPCPNTRRIGRSCLGKGDVVRGGGGALNENLSQAYLFNLNRAQSEQSDLLKVT